MKILFTNPISAQRFNCIPDLGQGYLMSLARKAGHSVKFLDCLLNQSSFEDFEREVIQYEPDIVGLKVYSIDVEIAAEMLRRVKAISPKIITIIGGPHPSAEAAENLFKQLPQMDYAFAGEAEVGFPPFLDRLATGTLNFDDLPGLIWRTSDGVVHANPRTLVSDLSSVPYPAWDQMDPRWYRWGYSFMTSRYPAAPMCLTRGCPHLCTFCGSHLITGQKVRRRSVDDIIDEIRILQRDYGVRSLDIVDENMVSDHRFAVEFCERLLSENINIKWNCPYGVRLDRLTPELVRLMERSGCFGFSVGAESGSDRILAMVRKGLTVEQIREQTLMIKRVSDIMIMGYFMMGFPEETREEIEMTIDLACSLPFNIAVFSPLRLPPGIEIYNDLVRSEVIKPELDYEGLGHHYFVRSYCAIPDEEMRWLYRKAYLRFYSRPKVFLKLIGHVRSWPQAHVLLNGLSRLVKRPKAVSAARETPPEPAL